MKSKVLNTDIERIKELLGINGIYRRERITPQPNKHYMIEGYPFQTFSYYEVIVRGFSNQIIKETKENIFEP